MTFIVGDNCIKCKHTDCVEVCPVDCFYEGPNFLVIHPDECIDCALCEPECPVDAIFAEDEIPEGQEFSWNSMPNWPMYGPISPCRKNHRQMQQNGMVLQINCNTWNDKLQLQLHLPHP